MTEKRDPLKNRKTIEFYDPAEKVKNSKVVTVRMVREKDDKYEDLIPRQPITISCQEDGSEIDGVILGHWIIPFKFIPVELLTGEDYELETQEFRKREEVEEWIIETTRNDLSKYYDINDYTLLHLIAYRKEPLTEVELASIQLTGETPESWIERCGDDILGGLAAYDLLKGFPLELD